MMVESNLKVLILITVFTVLWIMFFTIHRNYYVTLTRQRLFVIRAGLFNAALEGKIGFDDPAYQLVRQTINGMIRFTHNLSFVRWLAIVFFNRFVHRDLLEHFNTEFARSLDKLTMDQRQLLLRALADAHLQILRHLLSVSLLWIIFKPLSVVLGLAEMTKSTRRWAMRGQKRTDTWRRFDAEVAYSSACEDERDCGLLLPA